MSLKSRCKTAAARFIQDHRRNSLVRLLARVARFYSDSWEYAGYEFATSGEAALLRSLAGEPLRTIFDVGANVGDWSREARRYFPGATVHAFEAVPPTYATLTRNLQGQDGIASHGYGLGETAENVEITYYGADYNYLSSVRAPLHDHLPSERLSIEIRPGDRVLEELALPRIDYLKIDVEGMEYEVLRGFGQALREGRIGFIQFEHQPGGRLFKDLYLLLTGHGYRVGKIYAGYVEFRDYHGMHERTSGPNYFAVPAARQDLISRLGQGFAAPASPPA